MCGNFLHTCDGKQNIGRCYYIQHPSLKLHVENRGLRLVSLLERVTKLKKGCLYAYPFNFCVLIANTVYYTYSNTVYIKKHVQFGTFPACWSMACVYWVGISLSFFRIYRCVYVYEHITRRIE